MTNGLYSRDTRILQYSQIKLPSYRANAILGWPSSDFLFGKDWYKLWNKNGGNVM